MNEIETKYSYFALCDTCTVPCPVGHIKQWQYELPFSENIDGFSLNFFVQIWLYRNTQIIFLHKYNTPRTRVGLGGHYRMLAVIFFEEITYSLELGKNELPG